MLAWLNNIYRLEQNTSSWYRICLQLTSYQISALFENTWSNIVILGNSLILESQDKIHMPIIFECLFEIYVPYNRICNKCCLHPLMMRVYIPLFLTRFLLIIFDPLFDNHVQWLLLWFVYCNAMGTNNEWVVFWLSHALLHFFHVLK